MFLNNQGMPTATIDGASVYFRDKGKGLPVVLLHGFPLDGRAWMGVAKELAQTFRVVVPDLRGFGRSRDGTSFSLESLGERISLLSALLISL